MAEAIHGTYRTNFVLKKKENVFSGLPIGKINDSPDARVAIKARAQAKESMQQMQEQMNAKLGGLLGATGGVNATHRSKKSNSGLAQQSLLNQSFL